MSATSIPAQDRLDILDLYARQSHAVDSSDGDGWAATYTEDGVFESPTYKLTARGRTELKEFAEKSNGSALERGEQFRHLITAVVLEPVGQGRIDAKAYLTIIATTKDGSRIDRSLVVIDELRKDDGQWLFLSRKTYRDQPMPAA